MRWLLIALVVGCGGSAADGCLAPLNVCSSNAVQAAEMYLCDGGVCQPGEASAAEYFQCVCGGATGFHSLVFARPIDKAACAAARSNWASFVDANCR